MPAKSASKSVDAVDAVDAERGVALIEAAFTILVLVVILASVAAFLTLYRTPLARIEGSDAKKIFLSKPAPICELKPGGGIRPASAAVIDATLEDGSSATVEVPGEAPLTFNKRFEIRENTRTVFTADFTPVRRGQTDEYLLQPVPQGINVEYEDGA